VKNLACPPCIYCGRTEPNYKAADNVDVTCSNCVQIIVNYGIEEFSRVKEARLSAQMKNVGKG